MRSLISGTRSCGIENCTSIGVICVIVAMPADRAGLAAKHAPAHLAGPGLAEPGRRCRRADRLDHPAHLDLLAARRRRVPRGGVGQAGRPGPRHLPGSVQRLERAGRARRSTPAGSAISTSSIPCTVSSTPTKPSASSPSTPSPRPNGGHAPPLTPSSARSGADPPAPLPPVALGHGDQRLVERGGRHPELALGLAGIDQVGNPELVAALPDFTHQGADRAE